jgi:hypothetical protein
MSDQDFRDPFLALDSMDRFIAVRASDARRYGKVVMAFALSNREYLRRLRIRGRSVPSTMLRIILPQAVDLPLRHPPPAVMPQPHRLHSS